jgi:hypothetical protein
MNREPSADWEAQCWDLSRFHPAAANPGALSDFLCAAAASLEQAPNAPASELLAQYRQALGDVTNVLAVEAVAREVSAPEQAELWARTTEPAVLRCQAASASLHRALSDAAPGLLEHARGIDGAFLRQLASRASHLPPPAATPWATLARRMGLDRLRELHAQHLKTLLVADLSVGRTSVELRPSNLRALLVSDDRAVRRAAWEFRQSAATRAAGILQGINEMRALYRCEEARLSGYSDVLQAACAEFRISSATYEALCAQRASVRRFADDFLRWQQHRLVLERLEPFDVGAQPPPPSADCLGLENLLGLLESHVARLHPAFPGVLRELQQNQALLTDPRATFSAAWFTLPHYGGGTPLVHVPYHRTVDDFCAAAHEFGHACHTAVVARELGAIAAADEALCYSEVFSLVFEIAAVNQAYKQAAAADEREFWRGVVLEQAAHFLRTLPIRASFDELMYLEGIPSARAWVQAHAESSPSWLPLPTPEDTSWVLSTSSEDAPFQGRAYCLAFLLAYLGYLQPERRLIQHLLTEGPWLPLEEACRNAAEIDLTEPSTFAPVWEHLNRMIKHG